ncbi:hypothetical protein AMAG_06311 [Allomyces macrogynus ATCC 38327]|uniref:Uncharacterized protein n=1 Tax=Allomyces macrogynus (strain ATCC 38327) TaxID=578462 RepID=A0A0L0SG71_ALLM3|nr:hypothetical protein AMAG_06311 [Allomyces macrogynus ATCC 38327]|eukprot:KNE61493.1 hypothetical protein AMAG_06311 [Allomyces macrogynus ATCC 38327]
MGFIESVVLSILTIAFLPAQIVLYLHIIGEGLLGVFMLAFSKGGQFADHFFDALIDVAWASKTVKRLTFGQMEKENQFDKAMSNVTFVGAVVLSDVIPSALTIASQNYIESKVLYVATVGFAYALQGTRVVFLYMRRDLERKSVEWDPDSENAAKWMILAELIQLLAMTISVMETRDMAVVNAKAAAAQRAAEAANQEHQYVDGYYGGGGPQMV